MQGHPTGAFALQTNVNTSLATVNPVALSQARLPMNVNSSIEMTASMITNTLHQSKHNEDAVVPGQKQKLSFEEQMALYDKQVAEGKDPNPDQLLIASVAINPN